MKIRTKMVFLAAVMFAGFFVSLGGGLYTVQQVKIGSRIYKEISTYRDAIEQIVILKSDLNQVRAELLNLTDEANADERQPILENLQQLTSDINERFGVVIGKMDSEEKKVAVQDAQVTWSEFSETIQTEQIPAVQSGDRGKARELTVTTQKMRYERFIEQIDSTAEMLRLQIEEHEAAVGKLVQRKVVIAGVINLLLLLMVIGTVVLVARSITRPLLEGVAFASSVADGNLCHTMKVQSEDEIAELATALNSMVQSLGNMVTSIRSSSHGLVSVSGDIYRASRTVIESVDLNAAGIKETSLAMHTIDVSVAEVAQGVDTLSLSASETSSSILQLAASVEEVAQNTAFLAEAVDEVGSAISQIVSAVKHISDNAAALMDASTSTASSISEMDSSIREIEKNSTAAAAISKTVLEDAETGRKSVEAAITGMDEIRSASLTTADVMKTLYEKTQHIGDIIRVIDEVNQQTNLLALNAAIIAAQAGVHGRGFAVVADEIKELAERTRNSTEEIEQLITGVQAETKRAVTAIDVAEKRIQEGVVLAEKSGSALEKIVSGVQTSSDQVNIIARAAIEQAAGSRMIKASVDNVSEMAQQIGHATKQQAKESDLVIAAAARMKSLAGQVRSSTMEQAKASTTITSSTAHITDMIGQIKAACDNQRESTGKIALAVQEIEKSTGRNIEATNLLDAAVVNLSDQTQVLQTEMGAFRVADNEEPATEEAPQPSEAV